MDSLTQITLGAAVGEAVLGKKVGNKALFWGAVAGTIPDLDVLTKYFVDDPIRVIELHRGFSHSILFCVLFAPIFGFLIHKINRDSNTIWKNWVWLMFWGLVTHPILDSFTTWGTQFFWPLEWRIAFKNIFVIDPLYTLPYLIFLPMLMRLKKANPKRQFYNKMALGLSSLYMVFSLGMKFYTYQIFEEALVKQNIVFLDIETKPSPFNTFLWTANVRTEQQIFIGYYSVFDENEEINFQEHDINENLIEHIKHEKIVQRLKHISKDWYTIQNKENVLFFNDLRFGQMGINSKEAKFAFSYKLVEENGTWKAIENKKRPDQIKPLLIGLWNRIKGE